MPRSLLVFANVLASSASAVFWIVLFLSPGTFSQPSGAGAARVADRELETDVRSRPGVQLAAMASFALLLCNALYVIYGRRGAHPARHVPSVTPTGTIYVACDVLEQALRASGEALDDIAKCRVDVDTSQPRCVQVRAHFNAPDGVSIQAASQRLRSALGQRYDELVTTPSNSTAEFLIEFTGFSGKVSRPEAAVAGRATPESESSPFTGPRYPIDELDEPHGDVHS